jgi:predicted dehydrogenase
MSQPLRFGIVGTGLIARVTARAIMDSDAAELTAVASRHQHTADDFAADYASARPFGSWPAMIEWDGIDAVYVAAPTAVREPIGLAAARAGRHLLAEKPFDGLRSLQRLTSECRAHDVAFMDATHFVHHPRTKELRQHLRQRIGTPQVIRTAFFFPALDRGNIRFDQTLEPTGAFGDMAWYSMRAVVEFLPCETPLSTVAARVRRDRETGAVIGAAGLLVFEDGTSSTWDAGYDVGVCVMDLDILGTDGMISLDDFVLDWAKSFAFDNPDHDVGYTIRAGLATPADYEYVATPAVMSQHVAMIDEFVALARAGGSGPDRAKSVRASELTQRLLDAAWAAAGD